MDGYHTSDFIRTGRAGIITDIGKGREPGASRAITLDRKNRDRSSEIKGKSNINRGPMFSDISNRYKSNINRGLMFGDISNRYKSSKGNARFNNRDNNLGGAFSGSKDSLRSNSKNTLSLKESLKEEGSLEGSE